MKFILKLFFVMLAAQSCSTPPGSVSNAPTPERDRGNEIIAEYLKRDAAPLRKDRVRFTIRAEGEPVDIYELDVWRRQTPAETTTLSIIVKPAEDAGSGSLTIETPDKPAVNVTYSAARDEFRESDTGKTFFGGLTAQELLGEWDKYSYKFVGERQAASGKAFEVEGKLKEGQRSVIASNRVFFDVETYLPVEIRLFDSTGKELRTYDRTNIKTENGHTYVAKTEAVNHVYNSNISIEIVSREFPANLDDSMFAREKLRQFVRK